jgi:cytochrome c biogenesis protein CcmG, thiol:disulfide interchange protein DsbE
MRPRTLGLLALLVAAGLVAVVRAGGGGSGGSARAAPPLPAQVLAGPRVTLAQLRGRPAIVHFWASWCEPCVKEAPEIARLAGALRGRAALVGVDWSDTPANGAAFVRRHGWRFPILQDPNGLSGDPYGLHGLPSTVLLDGRGRIVAHLSGPQTAAGLLARLRALA